MDKANCPDGPAELQPGFYGKLPAHGDFVSRGLPSGFIQAWDSWLQHSISASRALLGEQWLDIYLTSPIWHFAFSPGLLDEHAWLGTMSPSVDSVGRYFSFCIAQPLPECASAVASFYASQAWFDSLEKLVLDALEERLSADFIAAAIHPLQGRAILRPPGASSSYVPTEEAPASADPRSPAMLLDRLIAERHPQFSYWCTRGSALVAPCVRWVPGLPGAELFVQMMDSTGQSLAIE